MIVRLFRTIRPSSFVLLGLGLGVVVWTGCDRPGPDSDESAESQPSESADKQNPISDDPPKRQAPQGSQKPGSPSQDKPTGAGKQPPEPSGREGRPDEGGKEISDEELAMFVKVQKKIRPKREELKRKLNEADDREQAKKAQQEIMQATRRAADEVGLGFERYRTIGESMKNDPELQSRLRKAAEDQNPEGN